jgi:hypothetical protein
MAVKKNGKGESNKAKAAKVSAGKGKGKDAKTTEAEAIDLCDMEIYSDKYVTAKMDSKGEKLLIACKVNCVKSGSGKSFTLVSLGGIKNAKCSEIGEDFGGIGGYFSVLCGYTQGAKD